MLECLKYPICLWLITWQNIRSARIWEHYSLLGLPCAPRLPERYKIFDEILKYAYRSLHMSEILCCVVHLNPQLLIFHNVTITFPEEFTQCTTRGSFFMHWQETAYNMFTFSCLFLLPLVIMITCYTRILIEISRMTKDNCK